MTISWCFVRSKGGGRDCNCGNCWTRRMEGMTKSWIAVCAWNHNKKRVCVAARANELKRRPTMTFGLRRWSSVHIWYCFHKFIGQDLNRGHGTTTDMTGGSPLVAHFRWSDGAYWAASQVFECRLEWLKSCYSFLTDKQGRDDNEDTLLLQWREGLFDWFNSIWWKWKPCDVVTSAVVAVTLFPNLGMKYVETTRR